jgi:hypothetical protein
LGGTDDGEGKRPRRGSSARAGTDASAGRASRAPGGDPFARESAARPPGPALQPAYGGGVRPVDSTLRRAPSDAPPTCAGGRRGGRFSEPPGRRARPQRLQPEPGSQRPVVSLWRGARPQDRKGRRCRAGEAARTTPGSPEPIRGPAHPRSSGPGPSTCAISNEGSGGPSYRPYSPPTALASREPGCGSTSSRPRLTTPVPARASGTGTTFTRRSYSGRWERPCVSPAWRSERPRTRYVTPSQRS